MSIPNNHPDLNRTHRALVLQGGGALGAYEAGVFQRLCEVLSEQDKKNGRSGNLFDIIAGTSAGAMNAAIIVNNVAAKMSWKDTAEKLCNFWRESATTIPFWPKKGFVSEVWSNSEKWREDQTRFFTGFFQLPWFAPFVKLRESPFFLPWYFLWPDNYGPLNSQEDARRYFSWLALSLGLFGTPGVLSGPIWQPDFTHYNNTPFNIMLRYSNAPLVATINRYLDHKRWPLRTSFKDGEPRLLFVSVDIMDSITATFDSYKKEDNIWKTEYVHDIQVEHEGEKEKHEKHVIMYNDGIGMEHLLTSMSSHLRHKPPDLNAETTTTITYKNNNRVESKETHVRYFWDGFYLSNTPLREVLQAHRDYWYKVESTKDRKVPTLEVFIVNLYPTVEKEKYPRDPDGILNRVNDVLYHDKTEYDEKVAKIVTDYVDLAKKLEAAVYAEARDKKSAETRIVRLMNEDLTKSKKRTGEKRTYGDLLKGRFDVEKVVRIELMADAKNDIWGKAFDFSFDTINDLIEQGYNDTSDYFKKSQASEKIAT